MNEGFDDWSDFIVVEHVDETERALRERHGLELAEKERQHERHRAVSHDGATKVMIALLYALVEANRRGDEVQIVASDLIQNVLAHHSEIEPASSIIDDIGG